MKTTRSMIAGVMLSFAMAGAVYADSGSHTPLPNSFQNQAERVQTAQASQAEMPAPRPGWNNGSPGVEWLTRKTNDRSEVNSTSQSFTGAASQPGVNSGQPAPMHGGYKQHNHSGSVTETH